MPSYRSKFQARLNRRRFQAVARQVKDRDGWRCSECGRAGRLEVHHIRSLEDGGDPYGLDNLVALCLEHHHNRHAPTRSEEVRAWISFTNELLN